MQRLNKIWIGYLIVVLLLVASLIVRGKKCCNSDFYAFMLTQIAYLTSIWLYWQIPDQNFRSEYGPREIHQYYPEFYSACIGDIGQGDYYKDLIQNIQFTYDEGWYLSPLSFLQQSLVIHQVIIIFAFLVKIGSRSSLFDSHIDFLESQYGVSQKSRFFCLEIETTHQAVCQVYREYFSATKEHFD